MLKAKLFSAIPDRLSVTVELTFIELFMKKMDCVDILRETPFTKFLGKPLHRKLIVYETFGGYKFIIKSLALGKGETKLHFCVN